MIASDTALRLIKAAKPPILYISSEVLVVAELVTDSIGEYCDDDDPETVKAIRAAAKPLKSRDGKIGRVTAHFFVGPAWHTMIETTDWLEVFETALETIVTEKETRAAVNLTEVEKVENARAGTLAKELLDEPAFSHGRTSFAKRLLLAQLMFPQEDHHLLNQIVAEAENLHWLRQSGYQKR